MTRNDLIKGESVSAQLQSNLMSCTTTEDLLAVLYRTGLAEIVSTYTKDLDRVFEVRLSELAITTNVPLSMASRWLAMDLGLAWDTLSASRRNQLRVAVLRPGSSLLWAEMREAFHRAGWREQA